MDLLNNSLDSDIIGYSEEIFEALKRLKEFNYKQIYTRRDLYKSKSSKISYIENLTNQFELIFEKSLKDLEESNFNSPIFKDHIEYIDDENYSTYFKPLKDQNKLINYSEVSTHL
jgi:dGTPase